MATPPSSTPPPHDPWVSGGSPELPTSPSSSERRRRTALVLLVSLGLIAVLLALGQALPEEEPAGGSAENLSGGATLAAAPATPAALRPYTVGSEAAPLHVVEYGDFRCPYCAALADDEVTEVIDRWVASGRLRFTWRDFAILGRDSTRAAKAAHAAARQGRFWPMHRVLFQAFGAGTLRTSPAALTRLARRAGVRDLDRFGRDLVSASTRRFEARSYGIGIKRRIRAVPTLKANGRSVRLPDTTAAAVERTLQRQWERLQSGSSPSTPPGSSPPSREQSTPRITASAAGRTVGSPR